MLSNVIINLFIESCRYFLLLRIDIWIKLSENGCLPFFECISNEFLNARIYFVNIYLEDITVLTLTQHVLKMEVSLLCQKFEDFFTIEGWDLRLRLLIKPFKDWVYLVYWDVITTPSRLLCKFKYNLLVPINESVFICSWVWIKQKEFGFGDFFVHFLSKRCYYFNCPTPNVFLSIPKFLSIRFLFNKFVVYIVHEVFEFCEYYCRCNNHLSHNCTDIIELL